MQHHLKEKMMMKKKNNNIKWRNAGFFLVLLNFLLSGLVIVQSFIITFKTYHTYFLDKCCLKAGIFEFLFRMFFDGVRPIGRVQQSMQTDPRQMWSLMQR